MPRFRPGLGVSVLGVACIATVAGALPPPPPPSVDEVTITRAKPLPRSMSRLEFAKSYHDFGPMMDDEVHETQFEFTNTGSDPLEILTIRADCGCTVPELDKKLYMPGESGSMTVTLTPEGKQGNLERKIHVLSNDANGTTTITIAAKVTPIVEITPKILTVGTTDRRRVISRIMTVTGRTDDFEVTGAVPRSGDEFSAKILGTESVKNRFGEMVRRSTIEVTFTPTQRIGDYNAQIEITTNDPRRASIRTQLIARVHGDLYTTPRNIALRGVRLGQTVTRTLRLKHRAGEPFNVLGGRLGEGNFSGSVTFEPTNPEVRDEWVITLEATPSVTESRIVQELLITTDAKDEETVRIDLRGVVRDAK